VDGAVILPPGSRRTFAGLAAQFFTPFLPQSLQSPV
jgi:hypothetical protein